MELQGVIENKKREPFYPPSQLMKVSSFACLNNYLKRKEKRKVILKNFQKSDIVK